MRIFESLKDVEKETLIKLEEQDTKEREQALDKSVRLRQIPRETGEFMYNFLIGMVSLHSGNWQGLEIGGSGGYSTMWQGLALKKLGKGTLTSLEIDPKKIEVSKKNLEKVGLQKTISLTLTDAKEYVKNTDKKFDYVFLDAEKEDYQYYLKTLIPKASGSIWLADNVISHADGMKDFLDFLESSKELEYTILTIGKGLAFIKIL